MRAAATASVVSALVAVAGCSSGGGGSSADVSRLPSGTTLAQVLRQYGDLPSGVSTSTPGPGYAAVQARDSGATPTAVPGGPGTDDSCPALFGAALPAAAQAVRVIDVEVAGAPPNPSYAPTTTQGVVTEALYSFPDGQADRFVTQRAGALGRCPTLSQTVTPSAGPGGDASPITVDRALRAGPAVSLGDDAVAISYVSSDNGEARSLFVARGDVLIAVSFSPYYNAVVPWSLLQTLAGNLVNHVPQQAK